MKIPAYINPPRKMKKLKEISDPSVRHLAMIRAQIHDPKVTEETLLSDAFMWMGTPEGSNYWQAVNEGKIETLPPGYQNTTKLETAMFIVINELNRKEDYYNQFIKGFRSVFLQEFDRELQRVDHDRLEGFQTTPDIQGLFIDILHIAIENNLFLNPTIVEGTNMKTFKKFR